MSKDIIEKILGFDVHIQTLNGKNKRISFLDFINMENTYLSINKRDNEYPYYELNLHIECDKYGTKYCDDVKQEDQMFMNSENVIRKKVAREILSMIETVCFSDEFSEYRVNNGSNGERDLIIKNIKNTYGVG